MKKLINKLKRLLYINVVCNFFKERAGILNIQFNKIRFFKMKWNLKDFGDPLESKYYHLTQELTNYEIIWKNFFGNCKGKIVEIELDEETNRKRKLLSEHNYTMFVDFVLINKKDRKYQKRKHNKTNHIDFYFDVMGLLTTYYNIKENCKKSLDILKISNNIFLFEDDYLEELRETVIHNRKLPFSLDNFLIPKEYNDKEPWDNFSGETMTMKELISEVRKKSLDIIQKTLSNQVGKVLDIIEKNSIKLPDPETLGLKRLKWYEVIFSGDTIYNRITYKGQKGVW